MSDLESTSAERLVIWTIYDRPSDFPQTFMARKYVMQGGATSATEDIIVRPDLASIRALMRRSGLTCIHRQAEDDPKIVESWI